MIPLANYPLHRPELYEPLQRGARKLFELMSARQVMFRAGTCIVEAGLPHDRVWRLRTGWCIHTRALADGRQLISQVFLPGDFLMVDCLLLAKQPENLESLTEATLNWMDRCALQRVVAANHEVALRLMWQLVEDQRRLRQLSALLGRSSAEARIAAMLLDFQARLRQPGILSRDSFRLPMTQQQIADYLGLSVVHVNRVLMRLRAMHVAIVRRTSVVILNRAELARLALPVDAGAEQDWAGQADAGTERP